MDENTTVTNPTDSADAVSPKEKISVKFTGGDGSEGYKNGEVYTLNKWEENGMIFIAREDGSGQAAYDSEESLMQNWEVQSQPETPKAE
jgi:hypothetical protein